MALRPLGILEPLPRKRGSLQGNPQRQKAVEGEGLEGGSAQPQTFLVALGPVCAEAAF